jgi:hypothetical protein
MTACPSRYLTSDGRVLVCLLDHRRVHKGRFTHRNSYNTTIAVMSWPDDDPCAWDAPDCRECRGSGCSGWVFPEDFHRCADCCPDCEGIGVDETIPLHLIGEGSKVRARAKTTCREVFLINVDTSPQVLGYCTSCEEEHTMDLTWEGWQLVRAVPPAHTEETP